MREVFAVMHKDMNLIPRIHVKRPGVAMYTGIPGVASYTGSPSVGPYTGNANSEKAETGVSLWLAGCQST